MGALEIGCQEFFGIGREPAVSCKLTNISGDALVPRFEVDQSGIKNFPITSAVNDTIDLHQS